MRTKIAALAALIIPLFAGCGAKLEGTYAGVPGRSFLESITLKSGGKVNVQFMGMTKQGTYEIDGREVTITVGSDVNVLTFDKEGCLVGGGLIGTYCKGADAREEQQAEEDTRLAGAYQAGDAYNSVRLDFERDGDVRMSLRENSANGESAQGNYTVDGDIVTVSMPEGQQLELRRLGDTLEGNVGYATLKFVKQ